MKIHSYVSSGGKDLIMDYIMNLTEDEKVDGLSVLEDMENGKWKNRMFNDEKMGRKSLGSIF